MAALAIHGHIGDFELVSSTGYSSRKIKLNNDYTYYTVTYDKFCGGYENYLQFFDKSGCTGSGVTLKCSTLINPTQYVQPDEAGQIHAGSSHNDPKSWPFDVTFGSFYQFQKQENNTYYAIPGL